MVEDVAESLKKCKEFLEQCYPSEVIAKNDNNYLEIDFTKVLAFDTELSDNLLDDPEEVIKIFQLSIQSINEEKKNTQVIFNNLPESTKISLSDISNQLGKFLTFEGYVVRASDIALKCYTAKFECPSCGNVINMNMLGKEFKEPTQCSCGRKGKFKLLNKKFQKFQYVDIIEATDIVPDKAKKLVKKKVYVSECLTRRDISGQLQPGQKVRIHGFLDLEEIALKNGRGKSNEFKTNIIANNLVIIENSWESIKWRPHKSKLIEFNKPDLLDKFAQSLAPSFEGYDLVKKSLILQHVGGKRIKDVNGNLEERGIIHVLMAGAPGSGKSVLMKRALNLSPLWNWTTGGGMTKAGLVASVVKDEQGSHSLEVGPLVLADNGSVGIDEMEKMNKEDFSMLNNSMAEEQTKITKANVDQTLKTRTSLIATSNPIHKTFSTHESILKQLAPIPKDIIDRFDVVWAMRENIDLDKMEDKYMSRHLGGEKIKQMYSNEDMRYYISYAKNIVPILTVESAKLFKDKFKKLNGKTSKDEESGTSHRLRGNIIRWAYAHTKFFGVGKENANMEVEVSETDIRFAFGLIRYSFKMLDLISEEGFVKYEELEDIPHKKEVNKFYQFKDVLKELKSENNNLIPVFKIYERTKDIGSNDEIDKFLEKLYKMGEILEPRRGFYALQ